MKEAVPRVPEACVLSTSCAVVRHWCVLYTTGLPTKEKDRRRAEIESDLWEHHHYSKTTGRSEFQTAGEILARMVLGMPGDIAWHLQELGGNKMSQASLSAKAVLSGTVIACGLSLMFAVGLLIGLAEGGWSLSDDEGLGYFFLAAVLGGLVGPFAVLFGAYGLRRADAGEGSKATGQVLVVVGTLAIASLLAAAWWTIIGPVIAAMIVLYWLWRLVNHQAS